MNENKLFDAIFRRAVEWMADCPEGDYRGVEKNVERTYVVLYVAYVYTKTMYIRYYHLMLNMDGGFSVNNGKGEYVPCADPMGAFESFVQACINERGDD